MSDRLKVVPVFTFFVLLEGALLRWMDTFPFILLITILVLADRYVIPWKYRATDTPENIAQTAARAHACVHAAAVLFIAWLCIVGAARARGAEWIEREMLDFLHRGRWREEVIKQGVAVTPVDALGSEVLNLCFTHQGRPHLYPFGPVVERFLRENLRTLSVHIGLGWGFATLAVLLGLLFYQSLGREIAKPSTPT